jgi:hypothetical protein
MPHAAPRFVDVPDGLMLTQSWPGSPNRSRRVQVIYYQHHADRVRRTLRGIDEQVGKADTGKVPVMRNWFITPASGRQERDHELATKACALTGGQAWLHKTSRPVTGCHPCATAPRPIPVDRACCTLKRGSEIPENST